MIRDALSWLWREFEWAIRLVVLLVLIRAVMLIAACSTNTDYADPLVGGGGLVVEERCRNERTLPCGWVYIFAAPAENEVGHVELCVAWPDRIGPYPVKLLESAESLYGDSERSDHPRFRGTPLCLYQCPSARGCQGYNGCFCLDGAL